MSLLLRNADAKSFSKDGNDLLEQCELADKGLQTSLIPIGYCIGRITGVIDSWLIRNGQIGSPFSVFCIPEGVTNDQLKKIVVKYLREHPETLHTYDVGLIVLATTEAFPCNTDGK